MTQPKDTDSVDELPPLAVIDAIDKWMHQQTRFHLSDTDGYKEMLSKVAKAIRLKEAEDRQEELDEAFVRNAPAFADEIDVEKYWNTYYENRTSELEHLKKGTDPLTEQEDRYDDTIHKGA